MTREDQVSVLMRELSAGYAVARVTGHSGGADIAAEAHLAAAVSHLVQTCGHRCVFDILTRAADAVMRAGNMVAA